eukprot:CAMPEP_0116051978 /NCGR_PEP_ID=MMETSP0322-20121206/1296_1 /TAXON_ID=163516 /ORGANISM="Leptocylindrus danicus var. apora, Strain B651" /LENGTH=136 /DNA_ID=CAMNT_0003534819 /DNA_START=89 /DNA_END=499 /DNA_ORIENTATION=+
MSGLTSSIPIQNKPSNLMANGPNSDNLAAQAQQKHYVDTLQRAHDPSTKNLDLDAVRRLYGSGLAMTIMTERRLAAAAGGRLPGMDATPDCNAMLDAVTGNDLEIGFEDLFNRAEDRPEEKFQSVNSKMEAKFGII